MTFSDIWSIISLGKWIYQSQTFMDERRGQSLATIDNAYNYYMSTYGRSLTSRYDTHKKSELRSVYNNIVKVNKESPLYKFSNVTEAQMYAIDIKEASKQIQHVVSSMSDSNTSLDQTFQKKIAISSDTDSVDAEYVGDGSADETNDAFSIEVQQLALPQINIGTFLPQNDSALRDGEYSFDLSTNSTSYEFQFTVHSGDSNLNIQNRLAKLINNADVGLNASVIKDESSKSALRIESSQTGLTSSEEYLFQIRSDNTYNSQQALKAFGIDQVSQPASNSQFLLNGEQRSSYSNTFTINKTFELHLKSQSEEGNPVTIGFKADADAIADNIGQLTDAYNSMVNVARNHVGINPEMNKLYNVVSTISNRYKEDLEPVGLLVNDDSTISIDKALLSDATEKENWQDSFQRIYDFKNTVSSLTAQASINPMDFVSKTVIAYKNPGRTLTAPYVTSIYAGMLCNFSC